MFPVYGSFVLFSLYLLSKYFNKDILSTLLSIYFTFLGQLCLINVLETHFTPTSLQHIKHKYLINKNIKFPFIHIVKFEVTQLRIITFLISIIPSAFYFVSKNYLLNNLFGIIFSITGIE
jgi:minor histocompatibility antigen H13